MTNGTFNGALLMAFAYFGGVFNGNFNGANGTF